jgi:hypothetical protein
VHAAAIINGEHHANEPENNSHVATVLSTWYVKLIIGLAFATIGLLILRLLSNRRHRTRREISSTSNRLEQEND